MGSGGDQGGAETPQTGALTRVLDGLVQLVGGQQGSPHRDPLPRVVRLPDELLGPAAAPAAGPQVHTGGEHRQQPGRGAAGQQLRLPLGELPQLGREIEPDDGLVAVHVEAGGGEAPAARQPAESAGADAQQRRPLPRPDQPQPLPQPLGAALGLGEPAQLGAGHTPQPRGAGGHGAHLTQLYGQLELAWFQTQSPSGPAGRDGVLRRPVGIRGRCLGWPRRHLPTRRGSPPRTRRPLRQNVLAYDHRWPPPLRISTERHAFTCRHATTHDQSLTVTNLAAARRRRAWLWTGPRMWTTRSALRVIPFRPLGDRPRR
ncbi:hypothetical protein CD790_27370 [Streptomyces sp. SAJ15]|nr:hypothetical protein CD790_27370 [Streptomyces sp. SAJ15]